MNARFMSFVGAFFVLVSVSSSVLAQDALEDARRLLQALSQKPIQSDPAPEPPAAIQPAPDSVALNVASKTTDADPSNLIGEDLNQPQNYVLVPNDMIVMRVFKEDNLETKARVDRDGTVTFPLIGKLNVGGRTVAQAADEIRRMYDKDYLVNPQITLAVSDFAKRRYTVLGQVQRPGAFELPEGQPVSLLEAISMAGGYTRIANPSKVTVHRIVNGEKKIFKMDAKAMARDARSEGFEVQADDVIMVSESIF